MPGRHGIDAYGNGGFRFAEMSHRGSILALPSGVKAWPVASVAEITEASLARCVRRSGRPRIHDHRDRTRTGSAPRCPALVLPRCADRSRRHADWSGSAHLQHHGRRKPQGRSGVDRRRVTSWRIPISALPIPIVKPSCARATRTAISARSVRASRQATPSARALRLQLRGRARPGFRPRSAARRNAAAMVAGRAAGRSARRRSRQSGCRRAGRHHRANSACRAKPWSI